MRPTNRLQELDALRGIAAIAVVFFHFTMEQEATNWGFKLGVTGVDLFFIISGFVIFLTLKKTKNWRDFAVSRVSRLYPAYWAGVALTTLFMAGYARATAQPLEEGLLTRFLVNLTMFQHYFRVPDIDGVYWTLTVEMLFYLLMAAIFIGNRLHRIERIGALLLIPSVLYGLFAKEMAPPVYSAIRLGIPLANHFPLFFAGIVFYKLKFESRTPYRYGLLAACLAAQMCLYDDGGRAWIYISPWEYGAMLLLFFGVFLLYVQDKLGFVANRFTLYLGDISYPIYLIHQIIGVYVILPYAQATLHLSFWPAFLGIGLPAVLLLSTAIHHWVEKPGMELIRGWYRSSAAKAASE